MAEWFPEIRITANVEPALQRMRELEDYRQLEPIAKTSARRLAKAFADLTPMANPQDEPWRGQLRRGRLRAGWRGEYKLDSANKSLLILIKNLDPRTPWLWPLLLKGSKPHVINAVRARFLVFRRRDTKKAFVGKTIRHPGFGPKFDQQRMMSTVKEEVKRLKRAILDTLVTGKQSTPHA